MVLGFIPDDGYTETAVLHEVRGLYPRVQFRFRPMLIEERVAYYRVAEKCQGMQLRQLVATYLTAKIQDWDLKDAKGQVLPLKPETFVRLKSRLFDRLFAVVSTEEAPDESPDKDQQDAEGEIKDLMEAVLQGRNSAEVR